MNYLIIGASRGLGALFAQSLPHAGDTVWLVARSQPDLTDTDGVKRIWIQADLADANAARQITQVLQNQTLDVCLYNAGIWETDAFSDRYDFEAVADDELERILHVNLTAAMQITQKMLIPLRRSSNGKIIFIGSNAGLENSGRPEVAYVVSKFGLRGLTHALRKLVQKDAIGVTCINLGDVGEVVFEEGQFLARHSGERPLIALNDIVTMLQAVIALSNTSCVKEIDLLAMTDDI
ncbi:MAG: SDR family oxidoreductase [Aggregatilineales bacterium]